MCSCIGSFVVIIMVVRLSMFVVLFMFFFMSVIELFGFRFSLLVLKIIFLLIRVIFG